MKVSVAVRQKFHGFNLAQELVNNNAIGQLYTSFYGSFFGKRNNTGFNIPKNCISVKTLSAIATYGLRNNYSFESDSYFGTWVAQKIGGEDIIVTWGIQALPIIRRARQLGIKVVLERGSTHAIEQKDLLLAEYAKLGFSPTWIYKSFSQRRIERELLEYELADVISIPSSFVKRSFVKHNVPEEKLFVNPYGANLNFFSHQPIEHKNFRLLYVGSISVRKGIHNLLEVFKKLDNDQIELWLVGNADQEGEALLKKYASKNIVHQNAVPYSQLSKFYNQCDAFIICSIEEGLAMVQLQAMASGLPLICSTNSGGDDLVTDGKEGFVFRYDDLDRIAGIVNLLLNERNLCHQMGEEANKKIASGYSWAAYGKRAIEFYQKLHSK